MSENSIDDIIESSILNDPAFKALAKNVMRQRIMIADILDILEGILDDKNKKDKQYSSEGQQALPFIPDDEGSK